MTFGVSAGARFEIKEIPLSTVIYRRSSSNLASIEQLYQLLAGFDLHQLFRLVCWVKQEHLESDRHDGERTDIILGWIAPVCQIFGVCGHGIKNAFSARPLPSAQALAEPAFKIM